MVNNIWRNVQTGTISWVVKAKGHHEDHYSKNIDFAAPGARVGEVLEMNHAYFALLRTFSLTHFVISRFKSLEQ